MMKITKIEISSFINYTVWTSPGSAADGSRSPAVLPASLAACMCVNSALVPSLVPSLQLSVTMPGVELQAAHHLQYNGKVPPQKFSMYEVCPEQVEDQIFAVVTIKDISASVLHMAGCGSRSMAKLSGIASVNVLEYGHLTMEEVLCPARLTLTADLNTLQTKNQNVDAYVHSDKVKFNPLSSGPHLVFSHLIICNNTSSTIRFGQAGTNENIVLNSREMCGYSWRSETCAELLHLCIDSPSWKWTEPFSVSCGGIRSSGSSSKAPTSIVRSVVAQDQSWVVIIRVKPLSGLHTQVSICGQLLVSNRLSQPISLRLSSSKHDEKSSSSSSSSGVIGKTIISGPGSPQHHHRVFTLQPGACLPSLVDNEVMASPVQFRLAGYHTSWSHDIFLSGDQMKDNQLVKIPLPDRSSYFHVWCRVFCQHFHGYKQKLKTPSTVTLRMVMLTPLYVVRTHLPRPLHIRLDSPKMKSSQEIQVASQGREFQLHCQGGDVTHHMAFRLGSSMQLSSPAVVLSTGLVEQLERSTKPGPPDLEQLCDLPTDTARLSWPYLGEDNSSLLDVDAGDTSSKPPTSQMCRTSNSPSEIESALTDSDLEFDLEPQPSVDLQVRLSEYIPGCDTLLVEVAPSCLVHNGTDMDLILASEDDDGNLRWTVRPGQTMAPPSPKLLQHELDRTEMAFLTITSDLQHGMRIICIRERFSLANRTDIDLNSKLVALPLSPNPIQMSETAGTRVLCPAKTSGKTPEHQEQSIHQGKQDSMPLFRWSAINRENKSPRPNTGESEEEQTLVCYIAFSRVDKSGNTGRGSSGWQWSLPVRLISSKDSRRTTTSVPDIYKINNNAEEEGQLYRHAMQESEQPSSSQQTNTHAELLPACMPVSLAVCVTSQQVKGVTHLVLSQDTAPVFVVENLCPFGLQFGQACDLPGINGAVIQEQVELVADLPWVPSQGWCHYTPPNTNAEFVNREALAVPKLFFRACNLQSPSSQTDSKTSEWSSPIQTSGNTDAFIQLRGFCDLKVAIEMVGMVTHLVIRPVSKAEVSAREIRSRLKGSGSDHIAVTGASGGDELKGKFGASVVKWQKELPVPGDIDGDSDVSGPGQQSSLKSSSFSSLSKASKALEKALKAPPGTSTTSNEGIVSSDRTSGSNDDRRRRRRKSSTATGAVSAPAKFSELYKKSKKSHKLSLCVGVFCGNFSLQVLDESMLGGYLSPLMAIHLSEMFFAAFPVASKPDSVCAETSVALSVGSIQVDNQRFGVGTYDFPVVFLPQSPSSESTPTIDSAKFSFFSEGVSILEMHAIMKSKAFFHTRVVTFHDPIWQQSGIESVDVLFKPFSVYVDDTYIYRVLEEIEAFSPSRLTSTRALVNLASTHQGSQGGISRKLPPALELNSFVLSRPVRVKHLSIQPIKMLLSVHASVRIFLASDHTPLNLAQFQRDNVFSTTQRLVHALTMHYASAAIFRAGIVVGSLEILGNPTGLVRSIGTGVSDLISLPYSGLMHGPSAFVYGLSRGVGSLFRNVSAGTITSVTNLASSISRNMDRLSLDTGHRQRQEESRRHRPAGLADGLRQGLTGFGISLLGAVAGLADHPMQTLLDPQGKPGGGEERRGSSPASTASGIMTGVGKGLVGVLTKPIGGAAEFVSQTGQGLLHGTGLGQVPDRLEAAETWTRLDVPDSIFKCVKKVLPSLPSPNVGLAVPAMTYDPAGQEVKVQLLLTPDVLVVVSQEDSEEDHQQDQDVHQVFTLCELDCALGSSRNLQQVEGADEAASSQSKSRKETGVLVVCWQDQVFRSCRSVEDGHNSSKDRVAAFIDNLTGQGMVAPAPQHLSLPHNELESVETAAVDPSEAGRDGNVFSQQQLALSQDTEFLKAQACGGSSSGTDERPRWVYLMDAHQLDLFLSVFNLAKNKLQGRGFPV
ncbi:vacuolar protein sorting-associated protein 13B [Elysia marginata]|uniref:Vacuolar protein sorting-associated protein 13B n=1 Tax=Elysia marginata TaxID=1093978 RepID=A0AAV4EQB5_9GAST|nr:vacuolar protein sorting-associated protein 13B [Elysia marginata]